MSDPKDEANKFIIADQPADAGSGKAETEDGRMLSDDDKLQREELARRAAEADMEVEIIDSVRDQSANPVQPVKIKGSDTLRFRCHKGVSCWNECCHDTDITLTPMDILALSKHLNMRPAEFLTRFTLPSIWDRADLPVAKLRVADEGEKKPCVFLDDDTGCTVYEDRPASCRYYPLGLAAVKMMGHDAREDFYFLVKEPHCKGHEEPLEQTVDNYRKSQGLEIYDEVNRGWMDILLKMTSWKTIGGPTGKAPDKATKNMFFMATTDVDAFRRFVMESKFLETYEIDDSMVEQLKEDDGLMLQLGIDWMKNVFFNEKTINMREQTVQMAIAKAQRDMGAG